jgi:hypothetical protein
MHVTRLRIFAVEVFKCLYQLNPNFLNELIDKKEMCKDFRDPVILDVPKFNKIKYGKSTFTYLGPHIWNLMPRTMKEFDDLKSFKKVISTWNGPNCQCSLCNL